jgi:hypothetical protein
MRLLLDGYGRCARCEATWLFTKRVEQCLFCGRVNRVDATQVVEGLEDNEADMRQKLTAIAQAATGPPPASSAPPNGSPAAPSTSPRTFRERLAKWFGL